MTDYNAAAEAARSLASQFRALLTVGEALSGFANFQNQQAELEAAKKTAEDQLSHVKAELEQEKNRLLETQTSIVDNVNKAGHIMHTANNNAKKIVADARNEAKEIIVTASKEAQEIKYGVDILREEYTALQRDMETTKDGYVKEIEELKTELQAVKDRFKF